MPVLLYIWSRIKTHWRLWLAITLLVGAFVAGRCSAPKPSLKAETTQTVQTQSHTTAQTDIKTAEQTNRQQTTTRVIRRHTEVKKDGTKVTDEQVQEVTGVAVQVKETQQTDTKVAAESSASQTLKQKIDLTPQHLPDWHVSVLLGAPLAFPPTDYVVGAAVERRILAIPGLVTLYGGVWALWSPSGKLPPLFGAEATGAF